MAEFHKVDGGGGSPSHSSHTKGIVAKIMEHKYLIYAGFGILVIGYLFFFRKGSTSSTSSQQAGGTVVASHTTPTQGVPTSTQVDNLKSILSGQLDKGLTTLNNQITSIGEKNAAGQKQLQQQLSAKIAKLQSQVNQPHTVSLAHPAAAHATQDATLYGGPGHNQDVGSLQKNQDFKVYAVSNGFANVGAGEWIQQSDLSFGNNHPTKTGTVKKTATLYNAAGHAVGHLKKGHGFKVYGYKDGKVNVGKNQFVSLQAVSL